MCDRCLLHILFLLLTLVGSFASFIDTERTMGQLSGELDRARARIGILEAEASRQRERYRALGMKRKFRPKAQPTR